MTSAGATSSMLRRLLEAAGYRLEDRPAGVRAVRARDHRAVFIVTGLRSPMEVESEFPGDAVARTLVYSEDPGEVARKIAAERSIEVLGPSALGPALGELLLPPLSAGGEENGRDSSAAPLEPPPTVFPEGERIIRPRLGQAEAEALAGVEGFRYSLRLVPFYVTPYRVRVLSPHGDPGPTSDHLIAVNGLTGHAEVWEAGEREVTDSLEIASQRLEPELSEEQSRAIAEEAVRKRHTVSVDHTEQHGGTLVIERRRVPPGPEDLRLGPTVLLHVPYWYVEGPDGRVVLVAVTGARALPDERELDMVR
ncbi:MAG: hypothetical protein L3J73_02190 [Thermoplasmata archaeon]|nr:hypothetical protein [Thermoplasmata archaeon]